MFSILSSKNQLTGFQEHPLFQQAVRAGLISNPLLLEQLRASKKQGPEEEKEKLYLEIHDMWCPSCAEIIPLMLYQAGGVISCVVDYATDLAAIEFAPRYISKDKIVDVIQSLGYRPTSLQSPGQRAVSFSLYLRFLIAAFFSLNIMMFAYPLYATYFNYDEQGVGSLFAWLSCAASIPVITYSAWPIWRKAWLGLRLGTPGMELLVSMGVSAAFGLSMYDLLQGGTRVYFDSMTVIIAFVLLGKIVEGKAKWSAKETVIRLMRAVPRRGRKRFAPGDQRFVSVKEIDPGDILVALTGEKVILDGMVVEGRGACDESLMTGESIPVSKEVGDSVLSGTLVQQGWLAFRVTATAEESALQRILTMVEEKIGHKAHYVRAVDPIVRWFVPIVGLVAAMAGYFAETLHEGILRAVSVLLISCPCAIGIAVPLAEAHLMNGLAKLGAIVRNRSCLQYLGRETTFVFDKTGTVTEGRFRVLEGLEEIAKPQKAILKGLVTHSNHPIACALAQAIEGPSVPLDVVEEFAGKGLRGSYQGKAYYVGSEEFMRQQGIKPLPRSTSGVTTTVYFGECALVLGDSLRPCVCEIISQLRPCQTILLSGDNQQAVEGVAQKCGFSFSQWGCHPLVKRQVIESLRERGEIVCMVGDGINDAPALTAAHVGMSVVSATDISIQISDLLLTTDRLDVILKIRALAQRGRRVIHQNLFWAFFYNVVGIGLAAFGQLSPIFAASAMVVSSLFVLLNAQRLSKYTESDSKIGISVAPKPRG